MRTERAYVQDIIDESKFVLQEMDGVSRERFFADKRLAWAMLHSLTIIGEAANHLSSCP